MTYVWWIILACELAFMGYFQKQAYSLIAKRSGSGDLLSRRNKLILMPGVIMHELSHYIMAVVCFVPRVEVKLFSPRQEPDGSVVLGYVTTRSSGPLRRALVSLAPVIILPPLYAFLLYLGWNDGAIDIKMLSIVMIFSLLTSYAAFPSPGDKPGFFGWLSFILLVVVILAFIPDKYLASKMLALIYSPATIASLLMYLFLSRG